MPNLADHNNCTGCMLCGDVCPRNAIVFKISNGFYIPFVDNDRCTECKLCEKYCPELNLVKFSNSNKLYKPYACQYTNKEILKKSSSGGAFMGIAHQFIDEAVASGSKWCVAGATLSNNKVRHVLINSYYDLSLLQGTKYLASNLNEIYKTILDKLKNNINVLFSGLPCHVNALNLYLNNKKYKGKLLTCDLICNGVPSFDLLDICLGKEKNIISFRDKIDGWNHNIHLTYSSSNSIHREDLSTNFLLQAICNNYLMRPSCYNCRYCNVIRTSDFTIGDFWGVTDSIENIKDGISLVIPHNDKAVQLLKSNNRLKKNEIGWEKCLPFNPRIYNGKRHISKTIPYFIKRFILKFPKSVIFNLVTGCKNVSIKRNPLWIPFKLRVKYYQHKENLHRELELKKILEFIKSTK